MLRRVVFVRDSRFGEAEKSGRSSRGSATRTGLVGWPTGQALGKHNGEDRDVMRCDEDDEGHHCELEGQEGRVIGDMINSGGREKMHIGRCDGRASMNGLVLL